MGPLFYTIIQHCKEKIMNYKWLTQRQNEVLALRLAGKKLRGIAEELGISQRTAELHMAAIVKKASERNLKFQLKLVRK